MPFTPFHLGPGVAFKAIGGRWFSLSIFAFSQVAIDIEPLIRLLRGDPVLHTWTHTYLGAAVIGLASLLVGRPVCQALLNRWTPAPNNTFTSWLRGPAVIPWSAAVAGAFIGTVSHVLLDSAMHADMEPLSPFSTQNGMLGVLSFRAIHALCVLSGMLGVAIICLRFVVRPERRPPDSGVTARISGNGRPNERCS